MNKILFLVCVCILNTFSLAQEKNLLKELLDQHLTEEEASKFEALFNSKNYQIQNSNNKLGYIKEIDDAYFASAFLWRERDALQIRNSAKVIPVCWINGEPKYTNEMRITKQAIESTWNKVGAAITFSGWGNCNHIKTYPNRYKGISIKIEDILPSSRYGNEARKVRPSMHLNFDFKKEKVSSVCLTNKERCIRSIAIHEFGHALGFQHEHDKRNSNQFITSECRKKYKNLTAHNDPGFLSRELSDWDYKSVMNYCFHIYLSKIKLSDCDKSALFEIYGGDLRKKKKLNCTIKRRK